MRYSYKISEFSISKYGKTYRCAHPVYSSCTLFKIQNLGLAIIQQYFNEEEKTTWWGPINDNLVNALYTDSNFMTYFKKHAKMCDEKGLYPTVTIRQIMWGLRMKPLKKEVWETVFDHCDF